jgi:hypothetical protein
MYFLASLVAGLLWAAVFVLADDSGAFKSMRTNHVKARRIRS